MNKTCKSCQPNEGMTDRIIRVFLGLGLLVLGYFIFDGVMQTVSYIIGLIALVTGAVGTCGIYALLGISTKEKEHKKEDDKK